MLKKPYATMAGLLIAALVASCAGTSFDWDQARQIKPGMTERQLVDLMGPPYMVRSGPEGQTWIWSSVNMMASGVRTLSVVIKDGAVVQAPSIPESFR